MNAVTETRAEHKNVFVALAAAQEEMEVVRKGSVNPAFKSRYADLADVLGAVLPALNRNGLTLFHQMVLDGSDRIMRTALVHGESETRIDCDVPLIVQKSDMQGMKSAITYAKRIGSESVTGIAPEDDDGNAAAEAAPKREERPKQPPRNEAPQEPAKPAPRDPEQIASGIITAISKTGSHEALIALFAEDTRASQAWDWLELEAPDHAKRVAEAKAERESALAIAAY